MADRGEKSASRKTARALPLTHRQQRATRRTQPESGARTSTPSQRKPATPARRKQPAAPLAPATVAAPLAALGAEAQAEAQAFDIPETAAHQDAPETTPPTLSDVASTGESPLVAETIDTTDATDAQPLWLADTTLLREPPSPAPAPEAPANASDAETAHQAPSAGDASAASQKVDAQPAPARRVKVRVRRKRPTPPVASPLDITRVDTDILPKIRIITPGETGPLIMPDGPLSLVAVDGAHIHDLSEVTSALLPSTTDQPPNEAPDQPAAAAPEPLSEPAVEAPEEMRPADAEPGQQAETMPLYSAALLAPELKAPELKAAETSPLPAPDPAESAGAAPARKMPTLAVMAALTQRAEPTPPAADDATVDEKRPDERQDERPAASPVAESAPRRLRAASPTAPLSVSDLLDPAALDALAAPATNVAPDAPDTQAHAVSPASSEPASEEDVATQANTTPEQAPQASGAHWMWWIQAVRRRAAPETRPIASATAAAKQALISGDDDLEVTAPRPASRRPAATVPLNAPHWDESPRSIHTERARLERVSFSSDALDADEAFTRRARAARARQHAGAVRSPRAEVLSWVAGGHAALAGVAALIAVIAALRSSAGPNAWSVFAWAITLALIAGLGAAVGYFCAQTNRPRLATLALLLSQSGALVWALGLLGPRVALLTLAPASVALALRGAGRTSAVATFLAWMLLFIMAEAFTLAGALSPALPLNPATSALLDVALPLVGLWLTVSVLVSLYTSRMRVVARGRALEHAALLTERQLDLLRSQTQDDAEALRRTLAAALRGEQPERVYAHGALSVVADTINEVADRIEDLRYDRAERKRLESAARRLTRVIERAWLGLSWSWPEATGTILDDLLALLRTPPPADTPELKDETTPTGQVVAPHLFRGWRPSETTTPIVRAKLGEPSVPSQPSAPSLPSLWPSDPGAGLIDPLELPPSPRWRSPDGLYEGLERSE